MTRELGGTRYRKLREFWQNRCSFFIPEERVIGDFKAWNDIIPMYFRIINLVAESRINRIRRIINSCHGVSAWPLILLINPLPVSIEAHQASSISLMPYFQLHPQETSPTLLNSVYTGPFPDKTCWRNEPRFNYQLPTALREEVCKEQAHREWLLN